VRVSSIGVMREGPLYAAVKLALAQPGDRLEVPVGRFVIDLVRADGELVEVQTGGFGALGTKLDALLDQHRLRIVHPIAAERQIVRLDEHGEVTSVRRSQKRATAVEVFDKLVAFPSLLTHPNLTIEVLLLREDHVRAARPLTSRRRTRDPGERRLVEVLDRVELGTASDVLRVRPSVSPEPFSTRELASLLGCSMLLAQRTAYCLRMIKIIEPAWQARPNPAAPANPSLAAHSDEHDQRPRGHDHSNGAARQRVPQPSRPWRHDREDARSGHQLQQRPCAAQSDDDQFSQPPVDRGTELAAHRASVRRAKRHTRVLQSLAHMSGVTSSAAPATPTGQ
jgi:hypothetical protein